MIITKTDKTLSEEHKRRISEALQKGKNCQCLICGNDFWRKPYSIKNGEDKFCSKECYFVWQKGRKRSDGFRRRCSIGQQRRNAQRTLITPINIRIRGSGEYKRWKRAVLNRDDNACTRCGVKKTWDRYVRLEVHHIKPFATFPERRFDVDNGITLCKKCHDMEPKGKKVYSVLD